MGRLLPLLAAAALLTCSARAGAWAAAEDPHACCRDGAPADRIPAWDCCRSGASYRVLKAPCCQTVK